MRLNLAPGRGARAAGTALFTCLAAGGLAVAAPPAGAAPAGHAADHPAAPLPSRASVAAAPAGRLDPANCTPGAGTSACDLYAMTGTETLDSTTTVPIWGFSTTATAGTATAPGPVLVVRQGDAVTITLHNQLADAVSLALPGQLKVSADGSAGDDVDGAAPGGTRTYTFTADRPGTFLYEAGHTKDG